jgi:hypothetical protein
MAHPISCHALTYLQLLSNAFGSINLHVRIPLAPRELMKNPSQMLGFDQLSGESVAAGTVSKPTPFRTLTRSLS